jgi:hypothetical protein
MDAGQQVRVKKADRLKIVKIAPTVETPSTKEGGQG